MSGSLPLGGARRRQLAGKRDDKEQDNPYGNDITDPARGDSRSFAWGV